MTIKSLVIIGAGPAGCAAAIAARMHGISATLIEGRTPDRRSPGETLHPGVEPILRQLGVWDAVAARGFHRHTGMWRVDLDGIRRFEPFGRDADGAWQGLQVDRGQFGRTLRDRAIDLGTTWIEMSELVRASRTNDGWTIESASGKHLTASIVMDATGRRAWFTSQLGLIPDRLPDPQRVQFGWSPADDDLHDQNPVFQMHADGWQWRAPIGRGRQAWVRLHRGNGTTGLDMTPRIFRPCAGPDWFLLGDAACLTTPAAGNGVLRALMSGIYAVHCVAAVRSESVSSQLAADVYGSWVSAFWESSVAGSVSTLI